MSNTTCMASIRNGTRAGCAPCRVRVSVTLKEETFQALRARADAAHRGLSGQAAVEIERAGIVLVREHTI
jgi:hypothetical protein